MSNKHRLSSEERRALLLRLLTQKAASTKGWYPLSYNQQMMWLVRDYAPESSAYHFALPVQIALDRKETIWTDYFWVGITVIFQQLMVRHSSLHTIYSIQNGEPQQKAVPDLPLCFEQADIRGSLYEAQQAQVLQAYHRPFDLTREGPMRVCLFRITDSEYILLMVLHHIAGDFWSFVVLIEDLLALTKAYVTKARELPPSRFPPFEQYVRWQAEMCISDSGIRHLNYWRKQLAGAERVAQITTDYPRPSIQSQRGAQHSFYLDYTLVRELRSLAKRENVTLYMLLVAALFVVLRRYTELDDLVLGSVANCRDNPEFTNLVGFLANAIILRTNTAGDPPFQIFLQQVRETVLDALLHQDYPFLLLVKHLHPKWSLSYSPIFRILFILQGFQTVQGATNKLRDLFSPFQSEAIFRHMGLDMKTVHLPQQLGQMDLVVEMFDGGDSLYGFFKYSTDLFEDKTISRMMNQFQSVLKCVVGQPNRRLSTLMPDL